MTTLQNEYSMWVRDPENNGIFDACEELGVGLVAYHLVHGKHATEAAGLHPINPSAKAY